MRVLIVDQGGEPIPSVQVRIREYNGVRSISRNRYTSDANGLLVIHDTPREGHVTLRTLAGGVPNEPHKFELGQDAYTMIVQWVGRIRMR